MGKTTKKIINTLKGKNTTDSPSQKSGPTEKVLQKLKNKNETDFLDEDPINLSQKFYLFSYALTPDPELPAMIKVRGTFSSMAEVEVAVKKLRKVDKYFHIHVGETGKWSPMLTPDKFNYYSSKNSEVEVNYLEENMQRLMQDHKRKKDESEMYQKQRQEDFRKARGEMSDLQKSINSKVRGYLEKNPISYPEPGDLDSEQVAIRNQKITEEKMKEIIKDDPELSEMQRKLNYLNEVDAKQNEDITNEISKVEHDILNSQELLVKLKAQLNAKEEVNLEN